MLPVSPAGATYSSGGSVRLSPTRPAARSLATYSDGTLTAPGNSRQLSQAVVRYAEKRLTISGTVRAISRAFGRFAFGGILSLLNLRLLSSAVGRYVAGTFLRSSAQRVLGRSYLLDVAEEPPPPVDATPPVVGNFSPTAGTPITKTTSIAFDVTDESGAFRRIFVVAFFAGTGISEVIHDGDGFRGFYSATSARQAIAGGFRYTVLRAGGWPAAPTIQTFAIDLQGNEVGN